MVLMMLMLIMMSNYLDRLIMTILQEPIKQDLGMSDLQLGLIVGPAFGLLYGLSTIPMARLAERFDRITLLGAFAAIWSSLTVLCGAVGSYAQLVIVRMGVGISEAGAQPACHSLVADTFPPRQRGLATALLGMAMPLAGFLAPLAGAYIADVYGWRWAFVCVGAPGIVLAILFRLSNKDPRKQANASSGTNASTPVKPNFLADLKWLFTNKGFMLIFIASASASMVMTSALMFTASFFLRKFELSLQEAAIVLSTGLGFGGVIGTLLGGWLADRFSGAHGQSYMLVPCLGALGGGVSYFIAYGVETWAVAGIFVVIASIFSSLKNGPNFASVQTLVPAHMRATGIAVLMLAITLVGTSLGPPLVGVLSDWAASDAFPAALGDYAEICHGGSDLAGELKQACTRASSNGLQSALRFNAVLYVLPVSLFLVAAKFIRLKLD
ncbi:hypothetical protein BFC17_04435 [Alteromonas lipolytica]|uniref:Major facilitator superfamily (MFS) profile domain-containing protein n=2 Tax=Alteromonas lipolytica TaxID=1856405 RepID=A0A1E8FCH6_9ALTE|nr:hypothetical protein BFC17_04435 [Alteromonas lipolytica]